MGTRATVHFEDSYGRKANYYVWLSGYPENMAQRFARMVDAATIIEKGSPIAVASEVPGGLPLAFVRGNQDVDLADPEGYWDTEYEYHLVGRPNGWVAVNLYNKKATATKWTHVETLGLDGFVAKYAPETVGTDTEVLRMQPTPLSDIRYYNLGQARAAEERYDEMAQKAVDNNDSDATLAYLMQSQRFRKMIRGEQKT